MSSPTTQLFYQLSPERVLDAAEAAGFTLTGRCMALNSYENRVYEVEIERDEESQLPPIAFRKVIKFYRPGRWSEEQILEEHQFLLDLRENEIPVVAPEAFPDGKTLWKTKEESLWYAIFPKVGGRVPDELDEKQAQWIGRMLGRIHNVGASRQAKHRLHLTPQTYGRENLALLLSGDWIPVELRDRYEKASNAIFKLIEPMFKDLSAFRIHGDCHPGNLLWGSSGPFFLDFDDMVIGPAVQDFWLLDSGNIDFLLDGYEEMRPFDRRNLKMIEPLRALRFIHYTAWLARRWSDPAFPLAFPHFNTLQYWNEKTRDMEDQLEIIRNSGNSEEP